MASTIASETGDHQLGNQTTAQLEAAGNDSQPKRLGLIGYRKYLWLYLALTIGVMWLVIALYLPNYEFMAGILGELETKSPIVILVLHTPAIGAIAVLLWYDGWRGLTNYLRTWVPRKRDLPWIPALLGIMLVYILAVRWVCQLFGIAVPPQPVSVGAGIVQFLQLFYLEVGMVAVAIGWFGFFLPLMHRATGSRIAAGSLTGLGIGIFVAPGNLLSSFELATAWPLYTAQLCVLGIAMALLLSKLKGNTLFFLLTFWMSASGSFFKLYYFAAATQYVQITLFTLLVFALYFFLKWQGKGKLEPIHTWPEYLEHDYTTRVEAPLVGRGDRSKEIAAGSAHGS